MSAHFTPSQPDPVMLSTDEARRLGVLSSDYTLFVRKIRAGKGNEVCVLLELSSVDGGDEPGSVLSIAARVLDPLYRYKSDKFRIFFSGNNVLAFRTFLFEYHQMLQNNNLSALPIRCVLSGYRASCIKADSPVSYPTDEYIVMIVPPREVAVPYPRKWFDTSRPLEQLVVTSTSLSTEAVATPASTSADTTTLSQAWFPTPQQRTTAAAPTTNGKSVAISAAATPHVTPLENVRVGKSYRIIAVVIGIAEPRPTTGGTGGYSQQLSIADTTGWIKTQVFGSRTHNLLSGPESGGVGAGDVMLIDALAVQSWQAGKHNDRQGLIQTDRCKWAIVKPGKNTTTTGANRLKVSRSELQAMLSLSEWYHSRGGRLELSRRFPVAKIRQLKQISEITSDREYFDIFAEVIHFVNPDEEGLGSNKPIDMYVSDYTAHPETRAAFDRFIGYHQDEWIQRTQDGPGGGLVFRISLWDLQKQVVSQITPGQLVIVSNVKSKWDKEYGISGAVGGKDDVNFKVRAVSEHPAMGALMERKRVWSVERQAVLEERRRLELESEDVWELAHGADVRGRSEMSGGNHAAGPGPGPEVGETMHTTTTKATGAETDPRDDASDISSALTDLPEDVGAEQHQQQRVVEQTESRITPSRRQERVEVDVRGRRRVEEHTHTRAGHEDARVEESVVERSPAVEDASRGESAAERRRVVEPSPAVEDASRGKSAAERRRVVERSSAVQDASRGESAAERLPDSAVVQTTTLAQDPPVDAEEIHVEAQSVNARRNDGTEAMQVEMARVNQGRQADTEAVQDARIDERPHADAAVEDSTTQVEHPREIGVHEADPNELPGKAAGSASGVQADAELAPGRPRTQDHASRNDTPDQSDIKAMEMDAHDPNTQATSSTAQANTASSDASVTAQITASTTAPPYSSSLLLDSSWPAPAQAQTVVPQRTHIVLSHPLSHPPVPITHLHKLGSSTSTTQATTTAHVIDVSPRDPTEWIKRVRLPNGQGHEYRLTLALLLADSPTTLNPSDCLPIVIGGTSGEYFMGVDHEELQQNASHAKVIERCRRTVQGLMGRSLAVDGIQGPVSSPAHTWSIRIFVGKRGHVLHLVDGCHAVCGQR